MFSVLCEVNGADWNDLYLAVGNVFKSGVRKSQSEIVRLCEANGFVLQMRASSIELVKVAALRQRTPEPDLLRFALLSGCVSQIH